MSLYTLSPIFNPQYIANAAEAPLTLATAGGGTVVPAGNNVQIAVARVANVTGSPCWLKLWRIPAGGAADAQHLIVPQINIPVAGITFPWFDLTALWGIVLQVGDSIGAQAQTANALIIHADGALITQ